MALFTRQQDTGDKLLELASDPFKSEVQTNSLWSAFGTYLVLSLGLALLFSLVRPRHRLVYAPKTKHADEKHAPPPMGNGLFSWIRPVTKAKEAYLVEKIGLDAVVFLRFTRMLRNIFTTFGFVGLCIMLPVNVSETKKMRVQHVSGYLFMTPMFTQGSGLWAQVIVAWIGNIIVAYFLWHNYRRIYSLRRKYFESSEYQISLHARTVMIRDLAANLRDEEGVVHVIDQVNPTGINPKVTVGRNVKDLPELVEEHEEKVRALESVLAKYLKYPDKLPVQRPTMKPSKKHTGPTTNGKVDSIDYLTERIHELEVEIGEIRERVDKRDPMPYAFASWDHIAQAHSVAFSARNKRVQKARIDLAPRPTDIIWKNLLVGKSSRGWRRFQNAFWIAALTIIWLPLNAAIAIFLSNLSNLGSVWPSFKRSFEGHPVWWGLVQGVAAPAITSLFYLILPIIFRRLQVHAGDVTKTEREQHVVRNLYTFFTLNNLILFSIFSAIWQYVSDVIDKNEGDQDFWDALQQSRFFFTITQSLCAISPFWVTFLFQRNLGAAIDLAQLTKVGLTWFQRKFMAPTPRQNIEWTAPAPFDYASYYNYFLFYATIALCFATLQPVILLVTAFYFAFDAVLKKYLLMYVFITKNESGGHIWRTLFNRLVFAAILSDFVVAMVVVARDQYAMAGALAPLVFLMIGFKVYCVRTFDREMKYYATSGMVDQEGVGADRSKRRRADKVSAKFGHPALWKSLTTPMVHAKAQPILSEIYRGRLGSDAVGTTAFSDIAMQPMAADGKVEPTAPFEFVSEAHQDYAFYKNRSDFREENLNGKPVDAVTERSDTPLSFNQTDAYRAYEFSAESSRANSPAPQPIKRKELVKQNQVHPAFRSDAPMQSQTGLRRFDSSETTDIGLKPGLYTDPDDDRSNLLGGGRMLNDEYISVAHYRTPGGTPGNDSGNEGGSYDSYFRPRQ